MAKQNHKLKIPNCVELIEVNARRHVEWTDMHCVKPIFCLLKRNKTSCQYVYCDAKNKYCITLSSLLFSIRNDKLFFDFYALHPIWVNSTRVIDVKNTYIDKVFTSVCLELSQLLLNNLEISINSEIEYVFGRSTKKNCGTKFYIRNDFSKKFKIKLSSKPIDISFSIKKEAFIYPEMWYADYGGSNWALACDYYMNLKKSISLFDINNMVLYIDKIFDLFHNTGHILNKSKDFQFLGDSHYNINSCVLNFRRSASLAELAPFCSKKIKNIINNSQINNCD